MNPFDQALKQGEEWHGSFRCQTCRERVKVAYLKEGTLRYVCSQEHVSKVEEFLK